MSCLCPRGMIRCPFVIGPSSKAIFFASCLAVLAGGGCTSIIGSFSEGPGSDGGGGTDAKHEDASKDASEDAPPSDAPGDSTSPSVTGNTASGLTAGGAYSTSANYKLVGSVGQAPGGNTSSGSASFKLQGGVIGATQ
jgi:hypothetical protein